MDTRGGVTRSVTELDWGPLTGSVYTAVSVAVPYPTPVTTPVLETVAMPVALEDHVTRPARSAVRPSWNSPCAARGSVDPWTRLGLAAATVRDWTGASGSVTM